MFKNVKLRQTRKSRKVDSKSLIRINKEIFNKAFFICKMFLSLRGKMLGKTFLTLKNLIRPKNALSENPFMNAVTKE